MLEIEAEYYDGLSPLTKVGTLRAENERVVFQWKDENKLLQTAEISYTAMENISELRGITRIDSSTPDPRSDGRQLLFRSSEAAAFIRERRFQSARGLWKLSAIMGGKPFIMKFALGLFLLIPAYFAFDLAFFQSYRVVSLDFDRKIGRKAAAELEKQFSVCNNKKLNALMERMAARLRSKDARFKYRIRILEIDKRNAFVLPGGYIYFFSGLISKSKSPEEVAGVLAHEISHAEKRHGVKQMLRVKGLLLLSTLLIGGGQGEAEALAETIGEIGSFIFLLRYSRSFEEEADREAVKLLHKARISVGPMIGFFSALRKEMGEGDVPEADPPAGLKPSKKRTKKGGENKKGGKKTEREQERKERLLDWLSSHPATDKRIHYLTELKNREKFRPRPVLRSSQSWKKLRRACD